MVYTPHRRHLVASLATITQALSLLQYLYHPSTLVLAARMLAQVQISAASYIHPKRSLFALAGMLTMMNVAAGMMHLLDFASGMNGGRGLVLDFVGQASFLRIIVLDLVLWLLQLNALTISYVTNRSITVPRSGALPSEDLLLPSPRETQGEDSGDDDELDLERGPGARRRTARDSRAGYEAVDEDEAVVWLDEDEVPERKSAFRSVAVFTEAGLTGPDSVRSRLLSSSASTSRPPFRLRDPPLILSLSFFDVINLIFHLPGPTPPPPAFAGGTPMPTPPATPGIGSPRARSAFLPDALPPSAGSGEEPEAVSSRVGAEAERDEEERRIPGEYWVESRRGPGG